MCQLQKTGETVNIKRICVFGPIGAGKSSLLKLFQASGSSVLSCDEVTHLLLRENKEIIQELINIFGPSILNHHQQIDRNKLAAITFSSPISVRFLEELLHPSIFRFMKAFYETIQETTCPYFVVEVPLFSKMSPEWHSFFDLKVALVAKSDLRKKRFMLRGKSEDEFNKRSSFHPTQQEITDAADIVITNDGTLQELNQQFETHFIA